MFNQISKIAGVGFATTLALALSANNAQALDFDFSFDNTVGSTPGTVEGIIEGLNDNSMGAASSIRITSAPPEFTEINSSVDFVTMPNVDNNSFTVANGEITNADFSAYTFSPTGMFLCLNETTNVTTCGSGFNMLQQNSLYARTQAANGFAAVTYSSATATPVPFEVSPNLSIIILGGLYGASRLRKKLAASR